MNPCGLLPPWKRSGWESLPREEKARLLAAYIQDLQRDLNEVRKSYGAQERRILQEQSKANDEIHALYAVKLEFDEENPG